MPETPPVRTCVEPSSALSVTLGIKETLWMTCERSIAECGDDRL